MQLNAEFPASRVSGRYADASQAQTLLSACHGADMMLVCSPTTPYIEQVARTALSVGIDYLDIHYPQKIVPVLNALAPAVKEAGRCFITRAGFHPGLPAAFVRYAAPCFSPYKKAIIGMAMNSRTIGSPESTAELVEDLGDYKAYTFKNGQWRLAGYKDLKKIDFGDHP